MARALLGLVALLVSVNVTMPVMAQDMLPADNGISSYHSAPRYRESESHPLRVLSYIVHPIGWVAREVLFRPLSYFASSTATTRSVMGYREPFDYRQPECFSADDSSPDCRSLAPFDYEAAADEPEDTASVVTDSDRSVFFPDVNFDFNKRALNELGKGRVSQIAEMLKKTPGMKVVLEGHADYVGSEEYNQKLGMDRSNAVRDALVAAGVEAATLATVSFGESKPLYTEQEDWARALNRRVSVKSGDSEEPKTSLNWEMAE